MEKLELVKFEDLKEWLKFRLVSEWIAKKLNAWIELSEETKEWIKSSDIFEILSSYGLLKYKIDNESFTKSLFEGVVWNNKFPYIEKNFWHDGSWTTDDEYLVKIG